MDLILTGKLQKYRKRPCNHFRHDIRLIVEFSLCSRFKIKAKRLHETTETS